MIILQYRAWFDIGHYLSSKYSFHYFIRYKRSLSTPVFIYLLCIIAYRYIMYKPLITSYYPFFLTRPLLRQYHFASSLLKRHFVISLSWSNPLRYFVHHRSFVRSRVTPFARSIYITSVLISYVSWSNNKETKKVPSFQIISIYLQ